MGIVGNKCYQLDINGLSVPDGYGDPDNGGRRGYVSWFWEDLDRNDGNGPCKHNPGVCDPDDEHYQYFR